jgi:hypothetical protein
MFRHCLSEFFEKLVHSKSDLNTSFDLFSPAAMLLAALQASGRRQSFGGPSAGSKPLGLRTPSGQRLGLSLLRFCAAMMSMVNEND